MILREGHLRLVHRHVGDCCAVVELGIFVEVQGLLHIVWDLGVTTMALHSEGHTFLHLRLPLEEVEATASWRQL